MYSSTFFKPQYNLHLLWNVLLKLPFYPRPQTCKYGNKCPKAHSVEELQESMMRATEEKEIRNNFEAQ